MRIVDEMVYSLEERGADNGITREGFAYEVANIGNERTRKSNGIVHLLFTVS